MLTNNSYEATIVTTGVRTLEISVSHAANDIVASLNTSFPIFVFSGRVKNTIPEREIIPLNLISEFLTSRFINNSVKKEKSNMNESLNPESLNPESLSSLTLTDILNDLLLSIEELSCILASSQDSIPANSVAGLLRNITNSTYYQLTKEGANNV